MVAEKYHRICSIGKGACGDVFLVRCTQNQKCYALKRVELDESRKTRRKESVLREAKIMADLRHPHIVKYHESFFDPDEKYLCIVVDYCDGGTLEDKIRDTIKARTLFKEKQIIQWFLQIAMAVRYLHSQKVLHRDLKTENVFLNKSGTICKLGDFGIAKSIDKTVEVSSTCVGTPCYLSPEMCQDIPYTSKADIWALGCILYELCALKPAFDAQNLVSLFYKIVKAEYEPVPDEFSDDLLDVLECLLTKEPEDRPSAQEILAMPYLRKELLGYIEENEFKLRQTQLPTREGPRPYTTPTLRESAAKLVSVKTQSNDDENPKIKRAVTCRPNLQFFISSEGRSRSAKHASRVATIQEETVDHDSKDTEGTGEDSNHTTETQKSMESESTSHGEEHMELRERVVAKSEDLRKSEESSTDDLNRSDLSQEEKDILRSAKGQSKTPKLIRKIIRAEQLRSRSLTPDSAKTSRPLPGQVSRGRDMINGSGMEYTNLMDGSSQEIDGNNLRSIKLDLSYRMTSISRLKLHDGKLPQIPLSNVFLDDTLEKSYANKRKQILEPQRTPRVPVTNALQVETEIKEVKPDERVFEEIKTNITKGSCEPKSNESTPKKQRHDSDSKAKEKEPEVKQKLHDPEAKSRNKLPKLKSKQNEPPKKKEQTSKKRSTKDKDTKDSKEMPKKASSQSKPEKKQAKIERKTAKEGTEIYYSDDFDEDSEIEEDIPEEIQARKGRAVSTVSYLDSADIPEELPEGEEGTDLEDTWTRGELNAAVTVAREVHDYLTDAKDELVVDTSVRQTSANVLIQRHCMTQLGAEKYEKIRKMCRNEASESDIRELESALGQENMKTFYLMNALAKTKEK